MAVLGNRESVAVPSKVEGLKVAVGMVERLVRVFETVDKEVKSRSELVITIADVKTIPG